MGATAGDPVALGLAKSLSRRGGNVTGANFLSGLCEKRLQLITPARAELRREHAVAGAASDLIDSIEQVDDVETHGHRLGMPVIYRAARAEDLQQAGELVVHSSLAYSRA
jgi:hypothetical protein